MFDASVSSPDEVDLFAEVRWAVGGAGVINWLFRNRRTGGITVAQFPNPSLLVFLMATVLRLLASPHGGFRTAVDVVARLALVYWAGDEVIRGVNPFRRVLGAGVLAAVGINLLR